MIKIDFQEPDTNEWRDWRTQCEAEQQLHNEAIQRGDESKVKRRIYKGEDYNIKSEVYMNLHGPFHGKCAYCESYIASDQDGGIEHFRPMNAVSNKYFNPVKIEIDGEIIDHPGYYWLCYKYKNFLPTCILCNEKRWHGEKLIGKYTRFPINGDYAIRPGEEDNEEALLLNPVFDYPEEHLELQETGIFKARTEKGQMCIDVFGLNIREALVEGRRRAFRDTETKIGAWWVACWHNPAKASELHQELMDVKKGEEPYSAGGRLALKKDNLKPNIVERINELLE